ncbi:diphosphomevalonate decarboxylase [Polyrhizophydium stewartii]|uniref:Diphosphomevalonate decarboxylase n=1 Tax=Polyrhizophydium stewartii TaxID=2732419 RepID=A0ABR4N5D5_9FUNG
MTTAAHAAHAAAPAAAAAAVHEVTCSAPVNIAVIKYWGKRDTALVLPTNSSLSVTLSQDHLRSTTTVRCVAADEAGDRLWLNGKEESIAASKRLRNVLADARRLRRAAEAADPALPALAELPLRICSVNNFPTAAGLASSASGFACLTYALHTLYSLPLSVSEASRLARVGSGSACRSLFGGFVAWEMGQRDDGADSMAVQVASETHWPDMEALILVVSDARKDTGSTEGMQQTVETSTLLRERIASVVPRRMRQMTAAIHARDFDSFAELTMADSNQFHAVCLDTYPPIFYMNDISRAIIRLVTAYNRLFIKPVAAADAAGDSAPAATSRGYRAAYTYDAGPNAVLYLPREHVTEVLGLVNHFFPPPAAADHAEYFGRAASAFLPAVDPAKVAALAAQIGFAPFPAGSLQRIISTHVGDGPRVLARGHVESVSLLSATGLPASLA